MRRNTHLWTRAAALQDRTNMIQELKLVAANPDDVLESCGFRNRGGYDGQAGGKVLA